MKIDTLALTPLARHLHVRLLSVVPALAALLALSPAEAGTLTWTLNNANFAGGGFTSGSFVTDDTTGTVLDWNIHTESTSDGFNAVNYTPAFTFLQTYGPSEFTLYAPPIQQGLHLLFNSPLTTVGANALDLSGYPTGSYEFNGVNFTLRTHNLQSGFATAVPESSTYSMLLCGLLTVGAAMRRRGRAEQVD